MSYIHSFKIDGLAGRTDPIVFQLDRSVNIFWGLNGTGKTSMLKILHAALRNESSGLEDVPFVRASVTFWSEALQTFLERSFQKDLEQEIFLDEDGDRWEIVDDRPQLLVSERKAWHTQEVILGADDLFRRQGDSVERRARERPYRHAYLPISRLSDVATPQRRPPGGVRGQVIDESFLDEQFARVVNIRWQEYNSTALLAIQQIQQQGLAQILAILFGREEASDRASSVNQSLVVREVGGRDAYKMVFQFLRQQGIDLTVTSAEFVARYDNEDRLQSVISSIEATTEKERQALRPRSEFTEAIGRLYSGGKSLILDSGATSRGLRVQIGDESIPVKALSSGEKQLLRLMLEVLAAESNTIMIDEPELSMHPDWQLVLVDTMLKINPSCQLILATHSPEIMADVASEKVFQL